MSERYIINEEYQFGIFWMELKYTDVNFIFLQQYVSELNDEALI